MPLKPASNASSSQNTDLNNVGKDVRFVALVWVLSHFWFAFFAYVGHVCHPFQEKIPEGYEGVSNWWLNVWTTFDSFYFLEIARAGYTAKSSAFFPLYPLLLRPFGPDENAMALAGVIISNLAFFVALFFVLRLTRRDYDEKIANNTVWILAFSPAAIFGMAVYTESLFLMFGVLSFWCFRRNQWHWGGLCCVLASLTRNSGPILTLVLLLEWWSQRKAGKNPPLWGLGVALLPTVVFLAVQFSFKNQFGDALSSVTNQSLFYRQVMFPLIPLWRDFIGIITGEQFNMVATFNWLATVVAFALLWKNRKRMPISDIVLVASILLVQLTFARTNPPYTNSSLRYLFATWPFAQMLAFESGFLSANRLRFMVVILMVLLAAAGNAFIFGKKFFLG